MKADGIEGTPTLIINGTKHSNMAYADLKAIIDAELAK
jgi:protein-disulfide isomerase